MPTVREAVGVSSGLIGLPAVAERLGVSVKAVRGLIARGELPAYRVANRLRVNPADLIDFMEDHRITPRPAVPPSPSRVTNYASGTRPSAKKLLLGE
jgi:excisionase family DNA binding protein